MITTLGKRKRTRALALTRKLYRAARGEMMWWRAVDMIVKRPAEVEVLAYAVEQGWLIVSSDGYSVRLTAQGWQAVRQGRPRGGTGYTLAYIVMLFEGLIGI